MFRGLLVEENGSASLRELSEDILGDGTVGIDVGYSGINYKDGLAITGRGRIIRSFPLIPGIDLVGTVTSSQDERITVGQCVVLSGDGIGESVHGGLAEKARVRPDALVVLPEGLSPLHAAAIGTAGFTAMLGVLAIADHGVRPGDGDVLVTGAAGGVGSIAVALLAGRGYRVVASTGRADTESEYLLGLGASEIVDRRELQELGTPLQTQRWSASIDSVGSTTLANILAQTRYGGIAVSCGLAQGSDLPTTVMPFILRGVTLHGANSVNTPLPLRLRAWDALAAELDRALLNEMTTVVGLEESIGVASRILSGGVRGRTVVDLSY